MGSSKDSVVLSVGEEMADFLARLQRCNRFIDWLDPLHEIAMDNTGLNDFGDDKSTSLACKNCLSSKTRTRTFRFPWDTLSS